MIIEFFVQNFCSIKDSVTLSFEATNSKELEEFYVVEPIKGLRLLKLGLIYGANASGKTTVLSALDFLRNTVIQPFHRKNQTFDYSPFLFDENSRNENSIFRLEFVQNETKYLYKLEMNQNAIVDEKLYYYQPKKALVYHRTTNENKQLTKINFGSKFDINKQNKAILEANTLWNNTVLGGYLKTNFESEEMQNVVDWFKKKLKALILPKSDLFSYISNKLEQQTIDKQNIIQFLKKADLKISDIIIQKQNTIVNEAVVQYISKSGAIPNDELQQIRATGKIEHQKIRFQHLVKNGDKQMAFELPYEAESQGTQRYYQYSGLLDFMMNNPTVFLIDEIASSLHPELLRHFLLSFLVNIKNAQLIATTHFRELLMEKDIIRKDAIWFTEKRENGSTDLFCLADFNSSVIRTDTGSIYNAYKIGKLGATPNLSDVYV
jgi:hypothetical protein